MCGGVTYKVQDHTQVIYFPNPYAQLPLLHKDKTIGYYSWGRREKQDGFLPITGWARHDSIKAGKWDRYNPIPVKIVVDEFMEKNRRKESIWYKVEEGNFIQGLLAQWRDERRVYVVTVKPDFEMLKYHDRFPRIINPEELAWGSN